MSGREFHDSDVYWPRTVVVVVDDGDVVAVVVIVIERLSLSRNCCRHTRQSNNEKKTAYEPVAVDK